MTESYMIVNVTRGLFDGHYFGTKNDWEHVLEYHREQTPDDRVIMVKVVSDPDDGGIPDERFLADFYFDRERKAAE